MIKTVALLGADGNLGPSVYKALLAHNFDVTVLKRASSRSKSKHPRTITIPDVFPHDELVSALQGIDAVVVTIRGNDPTLQKKLADASVQAGVKRTNVSIICSQRHCIDHVTYRFHTRRFRLVRLCQSLNPGNSRAVPKQDGATRVFDRSRWKECCILVD